MFIQAFAYLHVYYRGLSYVGPEPSFHAPALIVSVPYELLLLQLGKKENQVRIRNLRGFFGFYTKIRDH